MPIKNCYISRATMEAMSGLTRKYIEKWAVKFGVEVALIKAVCHKESGWNWFGVRIEHHLKRANWYKRTLQGIKEVESYHYCSFGLMQIMYGTARHLGYAFRPFALCNPKRNIKYGTKMLRNLMRRYKGKIKDAIAAYNQGNNRFFDINKNGIKDPGEKYYNQEYVDRVYELYKSYHGKL